MVFFTRLAVSLVLGVISLGCITAEKVSTMVPLKDAINSITDAKVKDEIKNLMAKRDMSGAESKMMKYVLDYATEMTPENRSEKDEFENDVVKAMKIIHEGFKDLKNDADFEETEAEEPLEELPEMTTDMLRDVLEGIPYPDLRDEAMGAFHAGDYVEAEKVLDRAIDRASQSHNVTKPGFDANHTKDMIHQSMATLEESDFEVLNEAIGMMAPNGTKSNHTNGMPQKPRKGGPMNQENAKMMVKIIEAFPDAAAKTKIINDLEAYDFVEAERHMLNALGDMMPIIDDKVRADVHEGMVALKAAVEPFAEEKKVSLELAEESAEEEEEMQDVPVIDAKIMAEAIQRFPDAAAKEEIIKNLQAGDFAVAETNMLDALAKMGHITDGMKKELHEGMVALKAAAEQYAEEQKARAEEKEQILMEKLRAEEKEQILMETFEKLKEDQKRIEGLLKELDGEH